MNRFSPEPPTSTNLVPSGDQSAWPAPPARSVTCVGSPPLRLMTHACGLPDRSEMNISRLPSGENRGLPSFALALVSCSGTPPSNVVRQSRRAYLPSSTVRRM